MARRVGIPIIPVQPLTSEALEWEQRIKNVNRELREREPSRHFLEFSDQLSKREAELWGYRMKTADCIEHVQLNEYHVFPEARDFVEQALMPGMAALDSFV